MEDCGAVYKNSSNQEADVFDIFETAGANLIRSDFGIIQLGQIIQTLKM